ncbi:MAG TPA: hypothetical protein VEI97_03700 [bacterium]|nr:hypothetical protein [bacterium]
MSHGRIQTGLVVAVAAGVLVLTAAFSFRSLGPGGPGVAFAQGDPAAPGMPVGGTETPAAAPAATGANVSALAKEAQKKPHGPSIYETHADQTPQALRSFETADAPQNFRYAGAESPVAQTTEKIRAMDITQAAKKKYEIAETFLYEDKYGRKDPLEPQDALPKELRDQLAGAGEYAELTDAELEELIFAEIRAYIPYIDIQVIGVIDNGVSRMAMIAYEGSKLTVQEGSTFSLGRWPIDDKNPQRYAELTMSVVEIREDFVQIDITLSYLRKNGVKETMEPVTRNFYIRMAF